MGDRANIYLKDSDRSATGMYVYTHWAGDEWPTALQEALTYGESRWGDPQYLARVIVSRVFKDLTNSTTGGGLSTEMGDNSYPLLCVDLINDKVGLCDPAGSPHEFANWYDVMSFKEFVSLPAVGWASFG